MAATTTNEKVPASTTESPPPCTGAPPAYSAKRNPHLIRCLHSSKRYGFDVYCLSQKIRLHKFDVKNTLTILPKYSDPTARPIWTVELNSCSKFKSVPPFRMYRSSSTTNEGRSQICEAMFHHHIKHTVDVKYPWAEKIKDWDPQSQSWVSQVGTLGGRDMMWDYNFTNEDDESCPTFRCTAETEKGTEEVCRMVWPDDMNYDVVASTTPIASIEISRDIFNGGDERQLDEVVSNAMIQLVRDATDWRSYTKEEKEEIKSKKAARKRVSNRTRYTDTSGVASMNASVASAIC